MSTLLAILVLGLTGAAPAEAIQALDSGDGALLARAQEGIGRAQLGAWATYRISDETGLRTSYLRWAIVGAELDVHGRPARWVELELGPHPALRAPLAQLRFLMATRAEGKPLVSRVFVGIGPQKVREVSAEALPSFQRAPRAPRTPAIKGSKELSIREGRPAKLNTAAGMLEATPTEIRYRETVVQRIWASPQVPFLGLARIEVPASGQELEVHEFGLDAKPRMILPDPAEPKLAPPEPAGSGVSP